jgi:hypothetical protein
MLIKASELRLADIVDLGGGCYMHATVKQIADGYVTMFRPYTQAGDFVYTGGVLCTIGIEEIRVAVDSSRMFNVLHRQTLK